MPLTDAEIQAIVDGIDSPDWVQIRLTASLSVADRVMAGMRAAESARMMVRESFAKRFPELTQSELNMKVLAYLTPIRGWPPALP